MSNQLTKKHLNFDVLDNIRGIAAIYVVINHCRGTLLIGGREFSETIVVSSWSIFTKIYYAILQITSLGQEMVILFFVLSGFSIAHSLKSNYTAKSYYLKRITRMYLPLIISLAWANIVALNITFDHFNTFVFQDFQSIVYNLFFIPTGGLIPQFWSISHEAIFYLFAPIINYLKRINSLYLILSAFFILFAIGFMFNTKSFILIQFIFDYSLFFIVGIILYFKLDTVIKHKFFEKKIFYFLAVFLIAISAILLNFFLGPNNRINIFLGGLAGFITIPFFIKHNINIKALKFLGTLSFTLYLSHFASIFLFTELLLKYNLIPNVSTHLWWPWLLCILFCILISLPLYYIAEKPSKLIILKLRSKTN